LGGYYIRYGTDASNLTQVINVSTVGLTSYVVDNLSTGTYYFAISSYTTAGAESSLTGTVSTTV
jgi:hypothetical protein